MPFPSLAFLEQVAEPLTTILKKYSAALNSFLQVEHKDDGTHSDVTADSLTVSGDVDIAGTATITTATITTETVGALTVTTSQNNSGSTVFTPSDLTISALFVRLLASSTGNAVIETRGPNANLLMSHSGYSGGSPVVNATVQLRGVAVGGLTWQAKNNGGTGGEFVWLDAAGATLITTTGWTTPTFAAGDYTGGGGWTVGAGDVTTAAYIRHGKTLTYATQLVTTSVTGGNPTLSILIPGSFTAAKVMANACAVISDNGVVTTGNVSVAAAGTTMNIQRTDGVNWTASANNTTVTFTITFEIQ